MKVTYQCLSCGVVLREEESESENDTIGDDHQQNYILEGSTLPSRNLFIIHSWVDRVIHFINTLGGGAMEFKFRYILLFIHRIIKIVIQYMKN
jgi:hypothetical protein